MKPARPRYKIMIKIFMHSVFEVCCIFNQGKNLNMLYVCVCICISQGQVPGAALPNPLNMLGPQNNQLSCPPVTQSPLHPTPPPASVAAGLPSLQHPPPPGMTPPQPAAPAQPSTPVSSSGQTPTPTPGSVPSAAQTQSTPTVQAAAQAQVTPQPQTPVQPSSVATPQSSQQQPTPVHAQPPGTPVSLHVSVTLRPGA